MEIKTQRCEVRNFEEKDINDFMKYRNNELWMQHQGFKGLTKEAYEKELLGNISFQKGAQFAIIQSAEDRLIGDIYLKQEGTTSWLGYTIDPAYSRQGYAYEVLLAIIDWLKQESCLEVASGVLPKNIASVNLLKKLGFTYTGTDDSDEQIYRLHLQTT